MANISHVNRRLWRIYTSLVLRPRFAHIGYQTVVFSPMQIDSPQSISIGDKVFISEGAWLMGGKSKDVTLKIGDNTVIGHFSHIVGLSSVEIGESVLMADKVYISDCGHSYQDVTLPVISQNIRIIRNVMIGEGSWIGENVCIVGACIGKHCIIGSNAVVTKDIPDYCVAVGAPAKVIKKYNFENNRWEATAK